MNPVLENTCKTNSDATEPALSTPIHDSLEAGAVGVAESETAPRKTRKCLSKSGLTERCTLPGELLATVLPTHSPCSQSSAEKSVGVGMVILYWTGGFSLAAKLALATAQVKARINAPSTAPRSALIRR